MRRAHVIGSPVAHSRSPAIFKWLAERLGVDDLSYTGRDVAPPDLSAFVSEVRRDPAFVGMNVTIPHKEAVGAWLDDQAPEAIAIGAVNAVVARGGRLSGHNTDAGAVRSTLGAAGCDPGGHDVAVWGAGGAARAVLYALGEAGAASVAIVNRDENRARALARRFAALFPATRFEVGTPSGFTLAIQATSAGMTGASPPADGLFSALERGGGHAFDLVYTPERTPFLARAAALGYETIGGLGMLVDQALGTWALAFGEVPTAPELRRDLEMAIRRTLGSAPIFLSGFMGVGKSTVARLLADRLGREVVDTDQRVEAEAGLPVSAIFATQGEVAFRALERRAVERAALTPGSVVALGGGALLDPALRALVRRAGTLVHLAATPETLEGRLTAAAPVTGAHLASSPEVLEGPGSAFSATGLGVDVATEAMERRSWSPALTRPLLSGPDRAARIRALLAERAAVYAEHDLRIDTDGLSPPDVADAIARLLP